MPPSAPRPRARRWLIRLAIPLAVALGLLALETHRRVLRLGETHPPQGALVNVDGVALHYLRRGTGPPVLLLHGSPGFLQDWQLPAPGKTSVFDDLARDHTVVAMDRPNYGWSGGPVAGPALLATQADLVAGLLEALGIERATLVGHSYGGGLALATAVRHPQVVAGIVLLGPVTYPEGMAPDALMRVQTWPVLGTVFQWSLNPLVLGPSARPRFAAVFAPEPPPPGYVELFLSFLQQPASLRQMGTELVHMQADLAQQVEQYAQITVPLTVLYGALESPDIANGVPRLAEAVPHSRIVELEGVGHELPHLRPQIVTAEVRRLTKTPVGGPPPAEAAGKDSASTPSS